MSKTNCQSSFDYQTLVPYCSSALISVILSRETWNLSRAATGFWTVKHATWQFRELCQKEGLTYEQMKSVSQCLVVCMILQARLCLF